VKTQYFFDKRWLPTTKKEVDLLGWEEIDVIIFSGDAYVDHPSFGPAVIGRVIEDEGFRVAVIPQPNWKDDLRDFRKLGKPKYFFGVTAGKMMHILLVVKPASDPIIRQLFILKSLRRYFLMFL